MTQYIDKSVVVTEIEKRMQELHPTNTHKMQVGEKMDKDVLMWLNALTWVKKILGTLEVKEVENPNDAFIEKAIGWIDYNNREGGCNFDGWEKDFKKHMEGE